MPDVKGGYERIMLAVDLTEESRKVAERAVALSRAYGAELHVVHVIEPLSLAYGGDIPMDLSSVQEQIHDQAKSHLAEFAATLGKHHQRICQGAAARVSVGVAVQSVRRHPFAKRSRRGDHRR